MDPAVIAALVTTPTAILAAGAAYAAGRAQSRGSVDAVRRQHQRESYADLVRAAHALAREVERWGDEQTPLLVAKERMRDLQEKVDRAAAIASLEGPSHLETVIDTLSLSALITAAKVRQFEGTTAELVHHVDEDADTAESAAVLFAQVARDYLNSGKRRKLPAHYQDENRHIRMRQLG
jgi:hypothetical protein